MRLIVLIMAAILLAQVRPADAALTWKWLYSGAGIFAAGTFTTSDNPNSEGFYQILGITGTDNGATITGLQPTGTAIPGNEPYAVDNLVRIASPQLTIHGFGFSLANGDYANPFHNGSDYYEYLSSSPYTTGAGVETPILFSASIVDQARSGSCWWPSLVSSASARAIDCFPIGDRLVHLAASSTCCQRGS
jgi:hypothetical protein